jgi:hypothetical protein
MKSFLLMLDSFFAISRSKQHLKENQAELQVPAISQAQTVRVKGTLSSFLRYSI